MANNTQKEAKVVVEGQEFSTVSPKYAYANTVRELFKQDPEVKLTFDQDTVTIDIEVNNQIKELAISKLMSGKKHFVDGDVTINVHLANHFGGDKFIPDVVYEAFKGNPLFDYMHWWADPEATSSPMCWVCMNPEVVIYPESNLHHLYGDTVKLPEDLATEVLTDATDYIFYCTDNVKREAPENNTKFFND